MSINNKIIKINSIYTQNSTYRVIRQYFSFNNEFIIEILIFRIFKYTFKDCILAKEMHEIIN